MTNRKKEFIAIIVVLCIAIWVGIYREISLRNYAQTTAPETVQYDTLNGKYYITDTSWFKYDTLIMLDTLPIIINADTSYYIYSKQNLYIYRRSFKNIYIYLKNGNTILIDTLNRIHIKKGKTK